MNEANEVQTDANVTATVELLARLGAMELRLDEQATENMRLKAENGERAGTIERLKATPAASPPKAAGAARQMGRRGLLAGAVALAAAAATQALAAKPALAADNQPLIMGQSNPSASSTWVTRDTAGDGTGTSYLYAISADTNGSGFVGYGMGTGIGLVGFS